MSRGWSTQTHPGDRHLDRRLRRRRSRRGCGAPRCSGARWRPGSGRPSPRDGGVVEPFDPPGERVEREQFQAGRPYPGPAADGVDHRPQQAAGHGAGGGAVGAGPHGGRPHPEAEITQLGARPRTRPASGRPPPEAGPGRTARSPPGCTVARAWWMCADRGLAARRRCRATHGAAPGGRTAAWPGPALPGEPRVGRRQARPPSRRPAGGRSPYRPRRPRRWTRPEARHRRAGLDRDWRARESDDVHGALGVPRAPWAGGRVEGPVGRPGRGTRSSRRRPGRRRPDRRRAPI